MKYDDKKGKNKRSMNQPNQPAQKYDKRERGRIEIYREDKGAVWMDADREGLLSNDDKGELVMNGKSTRAEKEK